MLDPRLEAALERGATVVTPNKRLARELVSRYDHAQLARGAGAWPAARVLPWLTFVSELVVSAQDAGLALPAHRLDAVQSLALWRRIVGDELAGMPLINVARAADLAAQAWEYVHAYGEGDEHWRYLASGTPDTEAFARWTERYRRELKRIDALDGTLAASLLFSVAANVPDVRSLDLVLAAFTELSPQQERLLAALERCGAHVQRFDLAFVPPAHADGQRAECTTWRDEIACAMDWSREIATADPDARIGIVVPDLDRHRSEVLAIAEGRLCAALQRPGRHEAARPYDISIGEPLANVPLIAAALDLIALMREPLARARAAVLLRSPYLPGATSAWVARAALERKWLEEGARELSLRTIVDDLAQVDGELAMRWRQAARDAPRETRASPRAWIEHWRTWLTAVGWNQERASGSAEYQAEGAWNDLLGAFARLALVEPQLAADDAIATLHRLARDQLFQPERPGARIRILGMLEASGLAFDALWVTGLAADDWPSAPQPNPLLPIAWQRDHRVPRSSPERELAFARQTTAALLQAAPVVVVSHAAQVDDHPRAASPLIAHLRCRQVRAAASLPARMFAQRPALETVVDRFAPRLDPSTRLPGGTGLIEAQSACPFRATGLYRLRAQPWPESAIGLSALERGKLLHAAFAAFWCSVRDHAALVAMDEAALTRAVAVATARAKAELPRSRWESLPPAVAISEAGCVAALLREWLVEFDRPRQPFSVKETEVHATLSLAGHPLDVRIDRVDSLATGGVAIVDYKSGPASHPARWFASRPQGLQLGLYALAQSVRAPEAPIRALVYAQVRPGEMRALGIADSDTTWPGLPQPADLKGIGLVDWPGALAQLTAAVEEVAGACSAGDASIAPRDTKVCSQCHLAAVCRIRSVREDVSQGAADA